MFVADISTPEPLDAAVIKAALGGLAGRFRLDVLDECASTSSALLEAAHHGAPTGSALVCERQSAGRGRRGRSWLSAPGDSLTFSLLWRFPEGGPPLAGLSLAAGVAVARALEQMGAAGIGLKWPNDILAAGGKLGGILVETLTEGDTRSAVIGIGLNVRPSRAIADEAGVEMADLEAVMPFPPSRNLLLAALLGSLAAMLDEFARRGFAAFVEAWLARHAYAGRIVHILADGAPPVEGRCAGVDADGALLLDTGSGIRRILSGEVTLRAT